MNRTIFSLGLLFIILNLSAQDYQITFGVLGQSGTPDSVSVTNMDLDISKDLLGDDILHLVRQVTGINSKQETENLIKVYPNPFRERANIEVYIPEAGSVSVMISDITGKLVDIQEYYMERGYNALGVSGLGKGTYVLKVRSSEVDYTALLFSPYASAQQVGNHLSFHLGADASVDIQPEFVRNEELKSAQRTGEIIELKYHDGHQLSFTAFLSTYVSKMNLVATGDQVLDFNFAPVPAFYASELSFLVGTTIQFTDTSNNKPTGWEWNFGDGSSSIAQHPSYTYNTTGSYSVSLKASNDFGQRTWTKTNYITVNPFAPVTEFSATPLTVVAGESVQFTDESINEPSSWLWSFGDDSSSTEEAPLHIYADYGTYSVALIAANVTGSDTLTKTNYITVNPQAPVADFSASPLELIAGESVQFTDESTNLPSVWSWDFGDGSSSSEQDPSHIYAGAGTYTVTLTATNMTGSGTEIKTDYITVDPQAPVADFSADPEDVVIGGSVQFTDESTNDPSTWSWDFGDGGSSTQENPSHTYSSLGTYTVVLTVSNVTGSDTETKTGYITVNPPAPVAEFSGTPREIIAGQSVQFTDQSTNDPTTWSWNFGDGGSSTQENPSHTYSNAGTYTVTLTAGNVTGTDSETKSGYITVNPQAPVAEFSGSPRTITEGQSVQFTDQSTNDPTTWSWTFGDGGTSTQENPSHIYASDGTYTVSLTVSNVTGSDTETKSGYITANPTIMIPVANFSGTPREVTEGESVYFTDLSTNTPTTWSWNFGDDNTSSQENPSHVYATAGTYRVSLVAGNTAGSDTEIKNGYITVIPAIAGTISDIDGNTYPIVEIGSQTWMAENLRTTHYADNTAIPLVEGTAAWDALTETEAAYCWWGNSTSTGETYGACYNWPAAMRGASSTDANPSGVQGVCPSGWHMPSDSEWKELEMYLGMSQSEADGTAFRGTDEGGKMKETGLAHWDSPNTGATNESGFTALASGFRRSNGEFYGLTIFADFWTATEFDAAGAWRRYLPYNAASVTRDPLPKNYGFSVRCVED